MLAPLTQYAGGPQFGAALSGDPRSTREIGTLWGAGAARTVGMVAPPLAPLVSSSQKLETDAAVALAERIGRTERMAEGFDIFGGFGASETPRARAPSRRFDSVAAARAPRGGSTSGDPVAKLQGIVDQANRAEQTGEQAVRVYNQLSKLFGG